MQFTETPANDLPPMFEEEGRRGPQCQSFIIDLKQARSLAVASEARAGQRCFRANQLPPYNFIPSIKAAILILSLTGFY